MLKKFFKCFYALIKKIINTFYEALTIIKALLITLINSLMESIYI